MSAPLQDLFALRSWGGGTDEFGNPSYTQVDAGNQAGDAPIAQVAQQLQQSGALTPTNNPAQSAGVGFNVDYSKLPTVNVGGKPMDVSGFSPWASPQQSAGNKLFNPNALVYSPDYGWVTPSGNIKSPNDFLDKIGNAMPAVIAAIAGAATLDPAMLGAQFTGGLGSLGAGLFNQAGNVIEGNKFNPMALLGPGLGAMGMPSWAGPVAGMGINAARGGGINPLTLLMTLGRMAGGGRNG